MRDSLPGSRTAASALSSAGTVPIFCGGSFLTERTGRNMLSGTGRTEEGKSRQ